ncbi:hypothetical protein [Paracidovorax sp. MALMAid1276]|uniref:hypothetical protein n=1 Tax=Paracidovorax sp. MALMAid1276 TaxID=3411631 RepID=UPI003B9C61CC
MNHNPRGDSGTRKKAPLYRKVNTTAHRVHHGRGGDFSDDRNARATQLGDSARSPMHGRRQLGLDYTPLFRFLLSKVGTQWDAVYSEARSRLDRPDPIFWLVALQPSQRHRYVRIGESSYYSGMCVDDNGTLQLVDPGMGPSSLVPQCQCCTHTFNGAPFTRRFVDLYTSLEPDGV